MVSDLRPDHLRTSLKRRLRYTEDTEQQHSSQPKQSQLPGPKLLKLPDTRQRHTPSVPYQSNTVNRRARRVIHSSPFAYDPRLQVLLWCFPAFREHGVFRSKRQDVTSRPKCRTKYSKHAGSPASNWSPTKPVGKAVYQVHMDALHTHESEVAGLVRHCTKKPCGFGWTHSSRRHSTALHLTTLGNFAKIPRPRAVGDGLIEVS